MQDAVPIIARTDTHVMGCTLIRYVKQKIHQSIQDENIRRILVNGPIRRHRPSITASFEKRRLIDFQRPTSTLLDSATVQVNCFPSQNIVYHYASLIATYLEMRGRDPGIVQVGIPEPIETENFLLKSNLKTIGHVDVAIVGDVDYLKDLCQGQWQVHGDPEHSIFRWNKFVSSKDKTIALIGCIEKIWGDAGGHFTRALRSMLGVECIIYVAKAGCLSNDYAPNDWIATGNHVLLGNESFTWINPLDPVLYVSPRVVPGSIVTVSTTLCETQDWLSEWSPKALWVDCEVAYMAKAALQSDIAFGFLHVVSDNLRQKGGENLSNEDLDHIIYKREILYKEIARVLRAFVDS